MATDADSFVLRPGDPLSPVVYGIGIKSRSRAAAARSVRPVSPPPRAAVAAKKPSDEFAISSGSETEDDDSLKRAQNPAAESAPKRQGSFILQKFPNKCQALTPGDGGGGGGDPILAAALAKKRRIEVTPLPSIFGRKEKDKEKTKPRRGDEPKISKKKKKKKFSEKYKDLIPPNRKYVAQARAADDISQMPAQPAAIDACGMDPDDPDSKVPEPEACRGRYLVAYSQCIYKPGVPPHPQFDRFDTYEDWVLALLYRSILWGDEHNKFLVASLASSALGQNPNKTPEKAWQECRYPSALRNENEYSLYILERGVQIEPLHEHLFRVHEIVCGCGSQLHRSKKWIMATPDAKFYEITIFGDGQQKRRGRHARDGEFKSPWSRDAFKEVPSEYMAQLQVTMEVDCVDEDDFSSLRVEDDTGRSEWIVVRVKRSKKYWAAALPVLAAFARAVLTGAKPPPRGTFVPPKVKTQMVVRVIDALDLIPGWPNILATAIATARNKSRQTAVENRRANEMLAHQKLETDRAAQAALDASFSASFGAAHPPPQS